MGSCNSTQKQRKSATPKEIVFSTSELLENILTYVPPKDLIAFRLVNSFWLQEATKILRKKDSLESILLMALPSTNNHFLFSKTRKYKPMKIESFAKFVRMAKSPSFPPTAYTVLTNNFARQEFFDFVLVLGNGIKELTLKMWDCEYRSMEDENTKVWGSVLTHHLPNLEVLTLYNYDFSDDPVFGTQRKLPMPNRPDEKKQENLLSEKLISATPATECGLKKLRILKLDQFNIKYKLHQIFIEKVTGLAPSLEKIHVVFEDNLMSFLHFLDKTRLITHVKTAGYFEPIFDMLIEHGARLEKLKFYLGTRKDSIELPMNVPALNRCLQISAYTLKEISIRSTLTNIDNFEFPPLPNLLELNLQIANNDQIFKNSDTTLPQLFPRLKKVSIEFGISSDGPTVSSADYMDDLPDALPQQVFFEEVQTMRTVTELTFSMDFSQDSYNIAWLIYLGSMFPNVKSLEMIVGSAEIFFTACPVLWYQSFRNLEHISLFFNGWDAPNHVWLDAAFTGFDPEFCTVLAQQIKTKQKIPAFKTAEELMSKRVGASILDLKKLKTVKLSFPDTPLFPSFPDDCRISAISSAFAFEMIPELQLIVCALSQGQDKFLRRHLPTARFEKYFEEVRQEGRNGGDRDGRGDLDAHDGLIAACFVLKVVSELLSL